MVINYEELSVKYYIRLSKMSEQQADKKMWILNKLSEWAYKGAKKRKGAH